MGEMYLGIYMELRGQLVRVSSFLYYVGPKIIRLGSKLSYLPGPHFHVSFLSFY